MITALSPPKTVRTIVTEGNPPTSLSATSVLSEFYAPTESDAELLLLDATPYSELSWFRFRAAISSNPYPDYIIVVHCYERFARFVVAAFPCLMTFGIGQTALLSSLAFISTPNRRFWREASAASAQAFLFYLSVELNAEQEQ